MSLSTLSISSLQLPFYPSGQDDAVASVLGNYYDRRYHPLGFIQRYEDFYFALSTAGADDLNRDGYTLLGGDTEIENAVRLVRTRWRHCLRHIPREQQPRFESRQTLETSS